MQTRPEALKEAMIMKRKLGKGWKVRVWENCGWHASCIKGPITVYEDFGTYNVLMPDTMRHMGAGCMAWTDEKNSYKDPRKAVAATLKLAENYLEQITSIVTMAKYAYIKS